MRCDYGGGIASYHDSILAEQCLAPFCRCCGCCEIHCRCDRRDFREPEKKKTGVDLSWFKGGNFDGRRFHTTLENGL